MKPKAKKGSAPKLMAVRPKGDLAPDEIALAAYFLWEQEGRPQGHEVENWLRAKNLLRQGHEGNAGGLEVRRLSSLSRI